MEEDLAPPLSRPTTTHWPHPSTASRQAGAPPPGCRRIEFVGSRSVLRGSGRGFLEPRASCWHTLVLILLKQITVTQDPSAQTHFCLFTLFVLNSSGRLYLMWWWKRFCSFSKVQQIKPVQTHKHTQDIRLQDERAEGPFTPRTTTIKTPYWSADLPIILTSNCCTCVEPHSLDQTVKHVVNVFTDRKVSAGSRTACRGCFQATPSSNTPVTLCIQT